jgi:hypothetical protein
MNESSEPDSLDHSRQIFPGYYLMTVRKRGVEEGPRYFARGLICRGAGRLYLTPRGVHFLRFLTRRPVFIPTGSLRGLEVRVSERRRIRGKLALEVDWERRGNPLRSVFVLKEGVSATRRVADWIQLHLSAVDSTSR